MKRPEIVTDEMIEYLDGLRDSGATNMFGAGPWLQRRYGVDKYQAEEIVLYYMDEERN